MITSGQSGTKAAFLKQLTSKLISPAALELFMHTSPRPMRRAYLAFGLFLFLALTLPALGQKPRLKVEDYQIDAEILPKSHHLTAPAKVKFTALEDVNFASFELHNALHPSKVIDANGKTLSAERVTQDNAVRVTFPATLNKGTTTTLTFDYEGSLANADDSPVEGLKLAYISEDVTYLLYPGRWFPVLNYGLDRFTSTINITAPVGTMVIGSGSTKAEKPPAAGKVTTSFKWEKPSFPGTIIAGQFVENTYGGGNTHVYLSSAKKQFSP